MGRRNSLLEALLVFRAVNADVSINQIAAFLCACEHERLSVRRLACMAGMSQSAAARSLRSLGTVDASRSLPALGLVESCRSDCDGRRRILRLTPAGERLRDRLDEVIGRSVRLQID